MERASTSGGKGFFALAGEAAAKNLEERSWCYLDLKSSNEQNMLIIRPSNHPLHSPESPHYSI